MMMEVTNARVLDRREAEARADGAVRVQTPLADVAIPSRLHLADQHDLLPLHVNGDAEVVARVVSGLENCRGGRTTEAEAGSDIGAIGLNHPLLVLPIAIGTAGVAVVFNVEDRNMRAVQDALAAIVDVFQFDARPVRA